MKDQHSLRSLIFQCRTKAQNENPYASLDWKVESPPVIFFGDADSSSGALVSGQLLVTIKDETLDVGSINAVLQIHVHQKKPFTEGCINCTEKYIQLRHWTFLAQPTMLRKGCHEFPFSALLEGNLPISLNTPLVNISYEFRAEVGIPLTEMTSKPSNFPIKMNRTFDVRRSLAIPEIAHRVMREFPPTNIKADASFEKAIHPTTEKHAVHLRLDGLGTINAQDQIIEYWKVHKISWRLEETIRNLARACRKHTPARAHPDTCHSIGGTPHSETRPLGHGNINDGWISDYSTGVGYLELEFEYAIAASSLTTAHSIAFGGQKSSKSGYICDTPLYEGVEVFHTLVIDMIASRERSHMETPDYATRTGSVRKIQLKYHVVLTDCPGLSMSWEKEVPPIYTDAHSGPPAYGYETSSIENDSFMR